MTLLICHIQSQFDLKTREEISLMSIKKIKKQTKKQQLIQHHSQLFLENVRNSLLPHEKVPENILINGTEEEMEY